MPRNPKDSNEFIAGQLPVVTYKKNKYYVDGRMKELRNVEDHTKRFGCEDVPDLINLMEKNLSPSDLAIIKYEFFGV